MNEQNSDLAMWTGIVAFFLPIAISVIQQPRWKQHTRAAVAVVVSAIAGAGTVYFTTPSLFDDGTAMTTVILTVIVASTAVYNHIYKPLGIRKLEDATSPGDDTLSEEEALSQQLEAMLLVGGEPVDVTIEPTT